ncbi:transmembrane protein 116-like [Scleropages formosus]|uniref:transmembrane protein 116-like n=1 Tax=Scleropages formosus TaxID=113540 RepID=UPI0008780EE6|nr:transmembrane protein 116-like [Scleropages formosus]
MDLRGNDSLETALTDKQIKALSVVYVSTLSLSVLGSFSVILVSIFRRQHLRKQARPLFQLALADLLAATVLLLNTAMNFSHPPLSIPICERGLPLSLTFYSISFLLVVVYAYESKRVAQGWRESSAGGESESGPGVAFPPLYVIVWVVPMSVYLLYVTTESLTEASVLTEPGFSVSNQAMSKDHSTFCSSCILLLHIRNDTCSHVDSGHDMFVKCFLLISVLLVLLCCIVVYSKVSSWFRGYEERATLPMEGDSFSRRRLRGLCATARSMVLVVTFCWTPVLALVVLSFVQSISQETLFPLYVIQALGVSLHGLLNSIVYGWRRRNFRDAARAERTPLLEKPFFEESLTAN